jgi:hypothetical protein
MRTYGVAPPPPAYTLPGRVIALIYAMGVLFRS